MTKKNPERCVTSGVADLPAGCIMLTPSIATIAMFRIQVVTSSQIVVVHADLHFARPNEHVC